MGAGSRRAIGGLCLGALALLSAIAAAPATGLAAPAEAEPVVYAQAGALWLLEGKTSPQRLGVAPADLGAVTALHVDAAARTLLIGSDVRWAWSPLRAESGLIGPLAFRKLPCAAGPATLSGDGANVLCATSSGAAMLVQLATGKQILHNAPIEQTSIAGSGAELRFIWADENGVWSTPAVTPSASPGSSGSPGSSTPGAASSGSRTAPPAGQRPAALSPTAGASRPIGGSGVSATTATVARPVQQLAPEPPRSGFSVSPTGERALGVYEGSAHHKKNVTTQEMLFGFALDGRAVRRKAIQRAVATAWSADGRWVLVQDGEAACIMAATGGQYKCWKGYRGAAISRDGRHALLLGNRGESKDAKDEKDGKSAKNKKNGKADKSSDKDKKLAKNGKDDAKPASAATPARVARPLPAHITNIDDIIDTIESGDFDEYSEEGAPEGGAADMPADGEGGSGEGGEGGEGAPADAPASSSSGELHLYRAALEGAFTLPPVQLAPIVDGPAAFAGRLR